METWTETQKIGSSCGCCECCLDVLASAVTNAGGGSSASSGSNYDCWDLSEYFGVDLDVDCCEQLVEWRIIEVCYGVEYVRGDIVDCMLVASGSSDEYWNDTDFIFCSTYEYNGYMELQVRCEGQPFPDNQYCS